MQVPPPLIQIINDMKGPWGVAVNQRGEVVVTEYGSRDMKTPCHRVSVFSPHGKWLRSFGSYGSGKGQLNYPHGVAVDDNIDGNILVADKDNHRIQKFSAEGKFLCQSNEGLRFNRPYGIAFNTKNSKVYVVDASGIQVLNSDLTLFTVKKTPLNDPRGIACDRDGKVYVAEYQNHRVQVFTEGGEFLRMFGETEGKLAYPCGVAVDSRGMLYVSEENNHRVSVFNSEGELVKQFGSHGKGPGQFLHPHGLCVDDSGVVYVCDSKKVQMF